MLKIIKDYSGSNIGDTIIDDNKVFAKFRKESITCVDNLCHNYNWHFAFGISNKSNTYKEISLFINCTEESELPNISPMIYYSFKQRNNYRLFNGISKTDTYEKYYIKIKIPPKKTIYIANFFFREYEYLSQRFNRLSDLGNAEKKIIGKTVEGRDLVCYKYDNLGKEKYPKKIPILITSGFHFPEQDTIATESVMEFFSKKKDLAKYCDFVFYIIPIVNPDGFVHGFNGCNANEVNMYWKFDEKDKKTTPEAYYLWKFIKKIKPKIYFDFHGYTFQLHRKKASAYFKPILLYRSKKIRRLVKSMNRRILYHCSGNSYKGPLTYAPSTLSMKLIKNFNTISYAKFHIHQLDEINNSKKAAMLSVFDIIDLYKKFFSEYQGKYLDNFEENNLFVKIIFNYYKFKFLFIAIVYSLIKRF